MKEPTLPYWMPAHEAQRIQQRQGKVLARLEELLSGSRVEAGKLSEHGFSCDAWVWAEPQPLLVEIKTSTTAADIHMGTGQLTLYPSLLSLSASSNASSFCPAGTSTGNYWKRCSRDAHPPAPAPLEMEEVASALDM